MSLWLINFNLDPQSHNPCRLTSIIPIIIIFFLALNSHIIYSSWKRVLTTMTAKKKILKNTRSFTFYFRSERCKFQKRREKGTEVKRDYANNASTNPYHWLPVAYFILSFLIRNSCQENQLWPENEVGREIGRGEVKKYFKYRPHRDIKTLCIIPILSHRGVFRPVKLFDCTVIKTTIAMITITIFLVHLVLFNLCAMYI